MPPSESAGKAGSGRKEDSDSEGEARERRKREKKGFSENEMETLTFSYLTQNPVKPRTSADHNFHIRSPFYACHVSTNSYHRALQL